ncbi:unnamed protein product [Lupinus luteus]|uniref:Reverse transcriptase zinc-binding domain-containing protein n=1 Tax=Lupinus luteus TaxID=3873 RepID=A0AAV1XE61_LUPLU
MGVVTPPARTDDPRQGYGDFSVASASAAIAGHLSQHRNRLADAIWSWKGPFRIILLLSRLVSNGLPTNDQRFKRNVVDSASCPRCNLPESSLHAMRDCPWVMEVVFNHTFREANNVADEFAKPGLDLMYRSRIFDFIPNFCSVKMLLDFADTVYCRGCNFCFCFPGAV